MCSIKQLYCLFTSISIITGQNTALILLLQSLSSPLISRINATSKTNICIFVTSDRFYGLIDRRNFAYENNVLDYALVMNIGTA